MQLTEEEDRKPSDLGLLGFCAIVPRVMDLALVTSVALSELRTGSHHASERQGCIMYGGKVRCAIR